MREINLLEGKVVAKEGMKVAIVASRFNEIIVINFSVVQWMDL